LLSEQNGSFTPYAADALGKSDFALSAARPHPVPIIMPPSVVAAMPAA